MMTFRNDSDTKTRFWSKVYRPTMWACWEWTGGLLTTGYGQFGTRKYPPRTRLAHRVAYELVNGDIPQGLDLDHLCRNRACVNPAHLEPVTRRVNLIRGNGTVGLNARKMHCKRGHPFDADNTYFNPPTIRQCKTCRDHFRK
jgi:hypothetical protein